MEKKEIIFPDCWEELTPSEWQHLLKLRGRLERDNRISLMDVKRKWVYYVLRGRGWREGFRAVEPLVVLENAAKSLDWMWKVYENGVIELAFDSTEQLLPKWRRYRGPKSHGADLTFGEFRHALAYCNSYTQEHRPEMLTALCGVLYRNAGNSKLGQWREPFNANLMQFYGNRIHKMPDYLKWGVYAWFSSFCRFLTEGTFIIDGHEVCFAPVFSRSKREDASDQSLGLNSILFSVAESGVFGSVKDTDDAPLLRVLMKLLDDHNKAEALRKEMKK